MTISVIAQNIKSIVHSIVYTFVETSCIKKLATHLLTPDDEKVVDCFEVTFNDMILDCEISFNRSTHLTDWYCVDITHQTLLDHTFGYNPYTLCRKICIVPTREPDKLKNVIEMITWSRDMLNHLKYDANSGELFDTRDKNDLEEIFGSRVVKMVRTECCVCYERTNTVTKCRHNICVTCASKLKPNEDDEVLCPMCREELYIE
jgi:hypothetical protein